MTTQQENRIAVPQRELLTTTTEPFDKLLTVREVARHLRVDDTTVRRWIKGRSLVAVTLPARGKRQSYRIKQSTLDALLGRQPA